MILRMATAPIPEADPERDDPNEFTRVERPLLKELVAMDWNFVPGDLEYPAKTFRPSFRETVLEPRLKAASRHINKDDHDDELIKPCVSGSKRLYLGIVRDVRKPGCGQRIQQ